MNSLDNESTFLKNPQRGPVAGRGHGDQRTLDNFPEHELQRPAGDSPSPKRSIDPIADVILPLEREAGNVPDKKLPDYDCSCLDPWVIERPSPMRIEVFASTRDRDRHTVRFRIDLQIVHPRQVIRLNRAQPNMLRHYHVPYSLTTTVSSSRD
ncbi:hypothetical protein BH11PLA2_BH11PLA2_18020 [soil metagenome]